MHQIGNTPDDVLFHHVDILVRVGNLPEGFHHVILLCRIQNIIEDAGKFMQPHGFVM